MTITFISLKVSYNRIEDINIEFIKIILQTAKLTTLKQLYSIAYEHTYVLIAFIIEEILEFHIEQRLLFSYIQLSKLKLCLVPFL